MSADEQGTQSKVEGERQTPSLDSILDRLNGLGSAGDATAGLRPAWAQASGRLPPDAADYPVRDSVGTPDPEPVVLERIDLDLEPSRLTPPEIPSAVVVPDPEGRVGFSFSPGVAPQAPVVDDALPSAPLVHLDEYRTPALDGFNFGLADSSPSMSSGEAANGIVPGPDDDGFSAGAGVDTRPDAEIIDIQHRLNRPPEPDQPVAPSSGWQSPPPLPEVAATRLTAARRSDASPQLNNSDSWNFDTDQFHNYTEDAPAFVQPLEKSEIDGLRPGQSPVLPNATRQPIMTAVFVLIPIIVLVLGWWLATRS